MKAQYYVKLESIAVAPAGASWFVGPFDREDAEAAIAAHREVYARTADAGFCTRGIMTKTEARSQGMRTCTLLGDRMPEDKSDFAELCAYAWQLA